MGRTACIYVGHSGGTEASRACGANKICLTVDNGCKGLVLGVPGKGRTVAVIEIAVRALVDTEADTVTILIDTDINFFATSGVAVFVEIQLVATIDLFNIDIHCLGNIVGRAQIPGGFLA